MAESRKQKQPIKNGKQQQLILFLRKRCVRVFEINYK